MCFIDLHSLFLRTDAFCSEFLGIDNIDGHLMSETTQSVRDEDALVTSKVGIPSHSSFYDKQHWLLKGNRYNRIYHRSL